jgi:hypothetical protein
MDNNFWWDANNDDGCVNAILKFSVEARKWYLKTDVKVRLARFILHQVEFEEIVHLWKRLNIIKKEFGEKDGSVIIQQAVREIKVKFGDPEWAETINNKIVKEREGLTDDFVKTL